ncbi:TRAP transporter substrate-binding protein [Allopusillimonas soli]|uniref:TRAP transporter substrate-binding protein n=1 Tax=Allopusillimonas soli TaxID=659016 RepID=A0A853FHB4_9BURK|nr:TRAP transporter substrate-binding protein [Allopusillimonas soli]NYT37376.1 TRAP transporter substrate-binding protein [Allopusillimonas soli]TEA74642.1 TRAP transporter substrate-binding protein [Allopusillimonas soli]
MLDKTKTRLAGALIACASLGLCVPAAANAADKDIHEFSIQTAVPSASLYFKLLQKFSKQIDIMSNGRLKAEVLAAGAVVGPFQILDSVSNGVIKAGYVWPNYFSGKNSAYVLFSNAPASTGLDQRSLVAWYYNGGGEALYQELMDKMHFNVKAFMVQPMGPDPLGWFKEPIESMDDFKNFKYRSPPGIPGETYKNMGVASVALPGGDIVPSAQRGVIDAAEWIGPADDRNLGLQKIWKYYYLQGLHQQTDVGQIFINGDFWKSLPPDLQEIIKVAAKASIAETFNADIYDNAMALHQFQDKEDVKVLDTPEDYYPKFIAAERKVTEKYAQENPFFKKVLDSQTEFAKMVYPYRSRILTLYDRMLKAAHEQHEAEKK